MAVNATIEPQSVLAGKIGKSMTIERNGEKYGIIGVAPPNAIALVGEFRGAMSDVTIDDIDTTIQKIQEEADKLKAEGINKIIVLSHVGFEDDKRIAQETSGVDIILGGHSHDRIKGVTPGENLLYSKTGEPVVLTQAGRDGEYAGILNVEFTPEGILSKVQNNLFQTMPFNRTLPARFAVEDIIGKPEIIAKIAYAAPPPKNRYLENNAHVNFVADAVRAELNTDISMINISNIRGFFTAGEIDSRRISDILPFENKMTICELSEKQIVDAIKVGGTSFNSASGHPSIICLSGMEYTMTNKGELKELIYIDREGNRSNIDVNNPSTERKFTVAVDDYIVKGGESYLPPDENPPYILEKFDFDKTVPVINYLKKLPHPIEIRPDERVKIVEA